MGTRIATPREGSRAQPWTAGRPIPAPLRLHEATIAPEWAATGWAARRRQFGQPIGRFQGIGFQLADMATELEAAELLTLRAAARLDRGTMTDADAGAAAGFAIQRGEGLPAYRAMLGSQDAAEGARAFAERREPRWQGR